MRTGLSILAALFIGLTAFAQNGKIYFGRYGSVRTVAEWNGIRIPENTVLGVKIIADNATYNGLSYADWLNVAPELATSVPALVERCVEGANNRFNRSFQNVFFSPITEGRDYLVTLILRQVSKQGDAVADVTIETPEGQNAVILTLKGAGGRYGSFINLMGDGMESLGYELAKRMNKARFQNKIHQ